MEISGNKSHAQMGDTRKGRNLLWKWVFNTARHRKPEALMKAPGSWPSLCPPSWRWVLASPHGRALENRQVGRGVASLSAGWVEPPQGQQTFKFILFASEPVKWEWSPSYSVCWFPRSLHHFIGGKDTSQDPAFKLSAMLWLCSAVILKYLKTHCAHALFSTPVWHRGNFGSVLSPSPGFALPLLLDTRDLIELT